MDKRVTPPKRVPSPTWGPPPPYKQALSRPLRQVYNKRGYFTDFVGSRHHENGQGNVGNEQILSTKRSIKRFIFASNKNTSHFVPFASHP